MSTTIDDRMAELERANAELRRQLDACSAELTEARDQQTATAEVLQVINSSPGDLAPVFDAILEKAHTLCGAAKGALAINDAGRIRAVATRGLSEEFAQLIRKPHERTPGSPDDQLLSGKDLLHITDIRGLPYPTPRAVAELEGARTVLFVPLRKEGELLGYITAYRQEVQPFTDQQIALLQNFAAQAVIAMENARLFGELRRRTDDLQESLEYQTAISDVLKVISRSTFDLDAVMAALVTSAIRLCRADHAGIYRNENGEYRWAGGYAPSSAYEEHERDLVIRPGRGTVVGRAALEGHAVQIADAWTDSLYEATDDAREGGVHTMLGVPLLREGAPIGVIGLARKRIELFTGKQIELVTTFADQTVIAMENARLLTETREALKQQTATAEVLQVINSSPGDLAPVFDAMLEKAMHLCEAAHGHLYIYDGDLVRPTAVRGERRFTEWMRQTGAYRPAVGSVAERVFNGHVVHIPNAFEHESYRTVPRFREVVEVSGCASLLSVPLRKGDTVLGAINVYRREIRPFSDKQIALLQNFAAQAVIAMENARLLAETREALQRYSLVTQAAGEGVYEWDIERDAVSASPRLIEIFGLPDTGFTTADWRQLVHAEDLPSYRAAMRDCLRGTSARLHCEYRVRHHSCEYRWIEDSALPVRNEVGRAVRLIGAVTDITDRKRSEAEIREALEQQTATAEVLQVINSSPGDLAPVFDAMLEKVTRLGEADFGIFWRCDGERFYPGALRGVPQAYAEFVTREPRKFEPESGLGRLVRGEPLAHYVDLAAEPFAQSGPQRTLQELGGIRSLVAVPLRREGELLGVFAAYRQEVRRFTDRQIALLQNFAAQAVIAMENARLITETREALEQQTATAEVLQVINSSPGDLIPVFDAMLEKAARLCEAAAGTFWISDGEEWHVAAIRGMPEQFVESARAYRPAPNSPVGRIAGGQPLVHLADLAADDIYRSGDTLVRAGVDQNGIRTLLSVPLRKEKKLLGVFSVYRCEVRPFSDKQIALVQNFAAQAVIAMENARLLTETREALAQQTATAEVLQVINSSPGDLAPVFEAILEKAHRLCGAARGALALYDGASFRAVAIHGYPEEVAEEIRRPYGGNIFFQRIVDGDRYVQIPDFQAVSAQLGDSVGRAALGHLNLRTWLAVPLRKEGLLLGYISAVRSEVRPFSEKEIALLENFAAQAVIAMENARLLTETREALEQQTATAEVLQVINSSPGDLTPVFDAMLERAVRLCEFDFSSLWTFDGNAFHPAAKHGVPERFWQYLQDHTPPAFAGVLGGERLVHIPDVQMVSAFMETDFARGLRELGLDPPHSLLIVPLRKDDALLGVIVAYRQEVGAFSDKQIALLQNFAAQAVIAMENARLLTETREALEQQTATAEVLQVINSSPGDLAPVFDAMLERAARLCQAAFGQLAVCEDGRFHTAATRGMPGAFVEYRRSNPPDYGPGTQPARLLAGERIIHIADMMAEDVYKNGDPNRRALVDLGGVRTSLMVPLLRDDAVLGFINFYRREVRPFTDKQIALLENFAAQAVIAMENARLITETREALEQQTATAEVLQVINSSPGDLAPVFDAMLERAHGLCGVARGSLELYDGENFRAVATHGLADSFAEQLRQGYPASANPATRPLIEGQPFTHILDRTLHEFPFARSALDTGPGGTLLCIPLRREDRLLGMIASARQEVRPFTDKQIALLQNFAAQAVIAMENARLLTETREALEQQTATAEVLQVINSSPGDLAPVFDTILEKAHSLCGTSLGALGIFEGENFRAVTTRGYPKPIEERLRQGFRASDNYTTRPLLDGARFVQIPDLAAVDHDFSRAVAELTGVRTLLFVPLRKDDAVLGLISSGRREIRPFSDKEIALLENFAAQAVIAMENARLLGELRQRTNDLQESLEYQTAISDVLKVISRSAFDLQTVLQTVVTTAVRLCRADSATIYRNEGGEYCWAAGHMLSPEYEEIERAVRIRPGTGTVVGRATMERRTIQILDAWTEPLYEAKDDARVGGVHTMIGVPLLRENAPIGVIGLARRRVEAFSEREIALVTTFADQAVIAIENARLIDELRDRTAELGRSVEELKMLGEVGRAVSSTLDLRSVLSAILTASLGVTMANAGAVFRYSRAERAFHLVEAVGWDEALRQSVGDLRVSEVQTAMGEATARRMPVQIADLAARMSAPLRDAALAAGFRSALIVPLVGAERIFGAITLMRHEAGEFPPETVRLMQTLASQSVLAIQNARLFREIADKSEQLALASQHKSQFLANMSHELRTPLNAILGYAELLVDGIYGVLPEKAQGVLERVQNNGKHLLALINDVLDLAKIEAGQLTLTLEDYALAEVVRGVVTATEPLAAAKGLKFTAIVEDGMPMAHGDARRVSQVLLNLAGNAIKFTDAGEVEINASAANGQFVLTVRDTGPGIADADQERIFGEFQQIDNSNTRKKGGTGLGLAISKRMVEIQGGMISVDSVVGEGSTFRVVLPVHVEPALEEAA